VSQIGDLTAGLLPDRMKSVELGEIFDMRSGRFIAAGDIAPVRDLAHPFPCYGGNGLRGT
jgi:type I restriction enzyme S subunit